MKDYSKLNSHSDSIMILIMDAYDKGYEDGKKSSCDCADNMDAEYNRGLNEAWEAAKKIILDDGLSLRELMQIFNTAYSERILKENTASEAIAKIKEYEEKQKQDAIQVGDEVTTRFGKKGVVITNVPCEDGNICVWFPTCTHVQMYPIKDLSKTGRHFDQIAEVLAEMRGEIE